MEPKRLQDVNGAKCFFFFCFFFFFFFVSAESERLKAGMLGKEMWYEISTCQLQYDANNKETDRSMLHTLWRERSSKLLKVSSILGSISQMIFDQIHISAIFALRLIAPLAS